MPGVNGFSPNVESQAVFALSGATTSSEDASSLRSLTMEAFERLGGRIGTVESLKC
jgi:hypothetical protein